MWTIFARDNMEVPVKIEENVNLRNFEVSGKKRNSKNESTEHPKKISVSTPLVIPTTFSPATLPATSLPMDAFKFQTTPLLAMNSPVALYVLSENPRFPGAPLLLPPPVHIDTNTNNNGIPVFLTSPITTSPKPTTTGTPIASTVPMTTVTTATLNGKSTPPVKVNETPKQQTSVSDFHSGHMDVDEHFRRSLANLPGCKDILDKCVSSVSTTSKNNTQVTKSKAEIKKVFDHSDIMSVPESVDDHFARALGADWAKLNHGSGGPS